MTDLDCYRTNYPPGCVTTYGAACGTAIHALCERVEQAERERDEARQAYGDVRRRLEAESQFSLTCQQERADSFRRLADAVGGVGCTEWQAEVDMEIVERITALKAERDRLRDEILRRGWWRESGAPCVLCGYDGEGYYQPATHDCARLAAELEGRDG